MILTRRAATSTCSTLSDDPQRLKGAEESPTYLMAPVKIKGLPAAINTVWDRAVVQTYIVQARTGITCPGFLSITREPAP